MTDKIKHIMPPNVAEREIHRRALDSANIIWTNHARERMEERGITSHDAILVLRYGSVTDRPTSGKKDGDWVCKIVKRTIGIRDVGVITAVVSGDKLIVITVEWEDL
jgi:hypothetical protein